MSGTVVSPSMASEAQGGFQYDRKDEPSSKRDPISREPFRQVYHSVSAGKCLFSARKRRSALTIVWITNDCNLVLFHLWRGAISDRNGEQTRDTNNSFLQKRLANTSRMTNGLF